ncbi:hypothetical protein ZOSMA_95G00310 [Zostera marina]|uniref:Uncharacterized protein n=1 Tax=Zostera marina TaxID=29655 RepID=A0A0K9NI34_ZOSMR|nr:hypothetical protein ZOSMA_95G00310 [Zostera marina]
MEMVERGQQTQGGGGDFFICFRSTRRRPARLRSSGSVRSGGARSPAMFTTATAEPTSPKVSCIGQVRVKTGRRRRRKQQQKEVGVETAPGAMRSRSTRETSFRRTERRSGRDRSWVHLPLGLVCDGLRSFGSEFHCCWNWKQIGFGSCFQCASCSSCSCACGSCSGRSGSCAGAGCGEGSCSGGGGSCSGRGCGSCVGNNCGGSSCSDAGCGRCVGNGCGGGSCSDAGCGRCVGNGCGGGSCSDAGCGRCVGNKCCRGSCSGGGCRWCVGNECCRGSCFGGGRGWCVGNKCCRGSCSGGGCVSCTGSDCGSCNGCGSLSGGCCGGRKRRKEVAVVVMEEMEVTEVRGLGGRRRRRELEMIGEDVAEEENIPVCVPPKNALLLMRCRSDPSRVSALKNRFKLEVEEEEDDDAEEDDRRRRRKRGVQGVVAEVMEENVVEAEEDENVRSSKLDNVNRSVLDNVYSSENESGFAKLQKSPPTTLPAAQLIIEEESKNMIQLEEEEKKLSKKSALPITELTEERRRSTTSKECNQNPPQRRSFSSDKEMVRRSTSYRESGRRSSFSSEGEARKSSFSVDKDSTKRRWSFSSEKESKLGPLLPPVPSVSALANTGGGKSNKEKNELPDCLLLMMYEPKLSMEVSKETWVCSADFVRWQPQRRRQQQQQQKNHSQVSALAIKDAEAPQGEDKKPVTELTTDSLTSTTVIPSKQQLSHKAEAEMAVATVPFVLTRCKSEPTRLSSPHGKMSMPRLIGVAGIGF